MGHQIFQNPYGEVSEWFKELVLKTSDSERDRGFESHLLRHYRGIAQLVEQRSPKPCAVGSSPTTPAIYKYIITFRGVAQLGSATGLGPVGRGFKSCHPDHCYWGH